MVAFDRISDIVYRRLMVGRRPLGVRPTLVRIPQSLLDRIDALLGAGRRAGFIRDAVEAELERQERKRPPGPS
jgi:hypothetical protein